MTSIFDTPLLELGQKANAIREKFWGKNTFYIKNKHINFTNICVNRCRFCAFSKKPEATGAYLKSVQEIVQDIRDTANDTKELHIVGGLNTEATIKYYQELISVLKKEFPEKNIKAFSAVEINFISEQSGLKISSVLQMLKKSGLDLMPGGGAEIFNESVRQKICPEKISGKKWLEIMRTAHKEGIKSNATMLYGHIETKEHREEHLYMIRKLQEETGGFNSFIPLAFQPENTPFSECKRTACDDLAVIAASRIILDNIDHIKAYWVMLTEKIAQLALMFGADDLDGTIVQENIAYAAGNKTKRGMTEKDLKNLILSAGLTPIERDSFYNKIG